MSEKKAPSPTKKSKPPANSGAALGFEATLWATAEQAVPAPNGGARLRRAVISNRGRVPALELDLIFLKYISDAFEEKHGEQQKARDADPEVRDFSLSASIGERAGVRCRSLAPSAGDANYAWVQHFIHHLAPTGLAGFVLANGSMSSNQSGEGEIRKAIIEADLVDS